MPGEPDEHDVEDQAASSATTTARDRDNARRRWEVAERQNREYDEVLTLALGAFGPGWFPSHRHFLVDREEEERARHTGERPQTAATAYTVKNAAGRARHFTVENFRVVEHAGYDAAFGPMLLEPHPTRGFTHRGQWCPIHRYSLCWAPYERYEPKNAEQLGTLRAARERKKAEREERRWAQENPLLAWAEQVRREGAEAEDGDKERDVRSP
jgi:hypothetical protein